MNNQIIIACSIFRYELEYLAQQGKILVPVVYINSMFHMFPEKLKEELDVELNDYSEYDIILLFGDCHAKMIDYEKNRNVRRTIGLNCCDIFLGNDKYRELRNEGAFIVAHEWAIRWKEVFIDYMGFKNSKSASLFMQDMHKKIVYINTKVNSINVELLNEISDFTGLPVEIVECNTKNIEQSLNNKIKKV